MIDFRNASFVKLREVDPKEFYSMIHPMLVAGEKILATYKGMRDGVIFTSYRIISINVQGVTGTKRDFTTLPYKNIQAFSVESAGMLDLDSELELWFAGVGKVKFEFVTKADLFGICRLISERVL